MAPRQQKTQTSDSYDIAGFSLSVTITVVDKTNEVDVIYIRISQAHGKDALTELDSFETARRMYDDVLVSMVGIADVVEWHVGHSWGLRSLLVIIRRRGKALYNVKIFGLNPQQCEEVRMMALSLHDLSEEKRQIAWWP